MTLGELIAVLEAAPDGPVTYGFGNPMSYRGHYEDLAFEPVANTTVATMLEAARGAMGKTFEGYKGGDFTMGQFTPVWLAWYGECGESIGPVLLSFMLTGKGPEDYGKDKEMRLLTALLVRNILSGNPNTANGTPTFNFTVEVGK